MQKYEVINENLTAITGLLVGQRVTAEDILCSVIAYAKVNKGMDGHTFLFDRYLWKKLELNKDTPLTIDTIWGSVCKYVEEIPVCLF